MELIKQITKAGNSSNVLLPKEWLGGTARVELIEKPLDIIGDALKILEPYLKNIIGLYLVGSHARREEDKGSDIDILAVTDNLNKEIKQKKYEIVLISQDKLERLIKENAMPIIPMIKEAKTIINEALLEKYRNSKLNKKNMKWTIGMIKSSQKTNSQLIELSKEIKDNISDGLAYSLVLGLRNLYIIDCLKNNKPPTKKGIKDLLHNLTKTKEVYEAYVRSKNNEIDKESINPETAEKINNYIKTYIKKNE